MMNNRYVVFILSHGRADRVFTYNTLRDHGYSGPIKIICDNEDDQLDRYISKYGDQVIVFDKSEIAQRIDVADNFKKRNSVVYARNACWEIAESLGYRYFIQLDDDYSRFQFTIDPTLKSVLHEPAKNLDLIFDSVLDFFCSINAYSIALAQGGDFIGGSETTIIVNSDSEKKNYPKQLRKVMNSFFCDTQRKFRFVSRMNDDVSTYTLLGSMGFVFFTLPFFGLIQKQTQSNRGGLTDMYLDYGTYVKSFYSVITNPSSVKIHTAGIRHPRLHHSINWNFCVPNIIRESHRRS
jgi:hypothetical protein